MRRESNEASPFALLLADLLVGSVELGSSQLCASRYLLRFDSEEQDVEQRQDQQDQDR